MRSSLVICSFLLFFSGSAFAQEQSSDQSGGLFSLGVRSSLGFVYENQWNRIAFGSGGQFRLRFSEKVNSDWFIDFLQGDLEDFGKRTDVHIGWSVLYYPFEKQRFIQPYILAGHCFELLRIEENTNPDNFVTRKSASVQAGAGIHLNISPRADISLVGQYMMHFGTEINVLQNPDLVFTKPGGISLQDHFLLHISINYQLIDLW